MVSSMMVRIGTTAVLFATVACSDFSSTVNQPIAAEADTYWRLDLNYHAINLSVTPGTNPLTSAPTNSVQLVATPRTPSGAAFVTIMGTPSFEVSDTSLLSVTPNGLVTAKGETGALLEVRVRWAIGSVTHADTAVVHVTSVAPASGSPLSTFSIHPVAPDSATWSPGLSAKTITPVAIAANGEPMDDLISAFSVSNPVTAFIAPLRGREAQLTGNGWKPDSSMLIASTYAYGVSKADTVQYTFGLRRFIIVDIVERTATDGTTREASFEPATVTIGIGGIVAWRNIAPGNTREVGVTFETPEAAAGVPLLASPPGNISPMPIGRALFGVSRSFATAGTYIYRDDAGRALGTIIVRADP